MSFSRTVRILVVDDEPEVRAAIEDGLAVEGYEVRGAPDGLAALSEVARWQPDALVLDVMMPVLDGLGVCRRLRAMGDRTPLLVLTALDSVSERIDGLDAGADDYLVKPFALDELVARVRALLRRSAPEPTSGSAELSYADLTIDPVSRSARRGERAIDFTRTEFALLELFLRHPGQVLPRELILELVWGQDFGPDSNSLAVYVGYLRRKLEAEGAPRLIHTVHGVGYRLDAP
ncbi:response regulator transcription factor [Streptomyces sp. NBC_01005]|uniref:response regulator transcription factor n=1 Tax=Streptomyces TaxID=1883 RepID=UPI00224DE135|nr:MULTISPECIES: response regulator transcription factor [unclassified Streptomyces]WSW03216.1 response regulator transcription factor [Streptomyces sp. NBC_01005]WTB51877.1 response regulator transcription factor [Streptomyces sp. NBC_00826]WTC92718.1 response regulator transcription factor [Streptomyces sp. NBC_01650]WTH95231.1 response regulator transcription factor [Streptomyces sp. NBC_00825]WTI03965.1 response regulator transcription factor [Streptomyces sp. NBC_00822]